MTRRTWTRKELDYVLANRDRLNLAAIARHLGRSRSSVVDMLIYRGLTRKKPKQHEWEKKLRRLHARGLSDGQMAQQMEVTASTIQRRRQKLALPVNETPACVRQGAYRKAMRTLGVRSLVEARWDKALDARCMHDWEKEA